jgi:TIR domain/AAA ATPase domain
MSDLPILSVSPIINYPRQAQVGKTYLMTIDLQADEGYEWTFREEEYPVYCTVKSDIFISKVLGEPIILMHRFGGSYKAARFRLTALPKVGYGEIEVSLINAWGTRVKVLKITQIEILEDSKKDLPFHDFQIPVYEATKDTISAIYQATKNALSFLPTNRESKKSSTSQKIPRVFISYSYDSDEHIDRVLALSDRLREDGVDCNIDQYEQSPAQGWYRWMIDEIEKADFVLTVCTPQYFRRFRANEQNAIGTGVTWEGSIITEELYSQERGNSKYILIVFVKQDMSSMSYMFSRSNQYNLGDYSGYELLYRRLTNQSLLPTTDLDKLSNLSTHERRQFFTTSIEATNIREKERCNLPYRSYSKFIGREDEIAELLKRISPDYRQHIQVVRGIGGVGKTALVLEVAYRCWTAKKSANKNRNIPIFDAIIFTSFKATDIVGTVILNRPEKEPLLTDIFRVISDVLNEPTITQVLADEQSRKVKEVLAKQSTLLIVDNMETLSQSEQNLILSFLNNVPNSTQVIITSRQSLAFDGITINSLARLESFALLEYQAKIKNTTIHDSWKRKIYEYFSGIPVALIYAVGKRAAGYQLEDIIDSTESSAIDIGKFCFESSVTAIRGTIAYQLLICITFFQNSPCRDALISVAGLIDGNQDVIDGLANLQQLSLVSEEKGRYSILPITGKYAISELETTTNSDFKRLARARWYNWYLDFTQQYGGLDWEGWRARYDRLDPEWGNIELVLNWYAERQEWAKVLQLWQNVNNYTDLSGYWQDRRYWWALLGKNTGIAEVRVKALSEKGFTLTLMGIEYYQLAEEYLYKAWELCKGINKLIQANVASHLAVLNKVRLDYNRAHYWLDVETELLEECQTDLEREKKRYQAQNLYYRAEILYLENRIDFAKDQFKQTIELTKEVGWRRLGNYAKNILADIYIKQDDLVLAEPLLKSGISIAIQARESRRIALYHASYARFYYKLAQKARQDELEEECRKFIDNAKDCAAEALKVFSKELMISERDETIKLIKEIDESWENYP